MQHYAATHTTANSPHFKRNFTDLVDIVKKTVLGYGSHRVEVQSLVVWRPDLVEFLLNPQLVSLHALVARFAAELGLTVAQLQQSPFLFPYPKGAQL